MKIAIYPGSFDPFTLGHLDILKKAVPLFDKIYVSVLNNSSKSPVFTTKEKIEIIQTILEAEKITNAEADSFEGLTVDYCRSKNATYLIRGLRSVTDFEYEFQLHAANRSISSDIETMFFMSSLKYSYLSSSIVRQIAGNGADISRYIHQDTLDFIKKKLL